MTIKLHTTQLRHFAEALDLFRQEMLPDDPEDNGGFYLMTPNTLYVDEAIDKDTIGELDKLVCRFEGHHKVLEKWQLARNVTAMWHLES